MSSQQDFKGVVSLSEEQYKTLSTTGTLTVGDITLTYSPADTVYVTPDTSSGNDEGILKSSNYNNTTFGEHLEELYTLSATKNLKYIRFKLSNNYVVSGTQATFSNSSGSLTLTNSVSNIILYNSVNYAFKFSGFDVNSNTLYVENQVYATNYFLRFNSLNSTPSLIIRGESVHIDNINVIFKECIETNASEFLNENLEYLIFEYYD